MPADPTTADTSEIVKATADAAAAGKFAALDAIVQDRGIPEMDGGALFLLAARDPRTKGKTPEDVAAMIVEDESVLDDLLEYRPGGMLADSGKAKPEEDAGAEEPAEPPEEVGKMKEYLGKSASMKDKDPTKALGNLRKMGKKMSDLDTDPTAKMDFMGME